MQAMNKCRLKTDFQTTFALFSIRFIYRRIACEMTADDGAVSKTRRTAVSNRKPMPLFQITQIMVQVFFGIYRESLFRRPADRSSEHADRN
ncbi:hypothetical protein HMPREF3156_02149 [Neisseria sp. HMSC06F02]|nr:hypothetical protein HMPREF3156_02149 [Neisseria sp. HMSC06F02]